MAKNGKRMVRFSWFSPQGGKNFPSESGRVDLEIEGTITPERLEDGGDIISAIREETLVMNITILSWSMFE